METSDRWESIFIFMRPRGTCTIHSIETTQPEQSRGWDEDGMVLCGMAVYGGFALCTGGNEGSRKEIRYMHFQEPQWSIVQSLC